MKPILRKVDAGHNYSFSIREDIYPYLYNHWHYHPEVELTLIRKGTGLRLVGDSVEQFEDGDLVLLGSNVPHMWRNDSIYFNENANIHVEAIAIHFNEKFWGEAFLELPEIKPVKELLEKAKRGIKITGKTKRQITENMEATLHADGIQRIVHLLQMLNQVASSNDYEFLSSPDFERSYNLDNTDRINLIYTYTLNNFRRHISIKDVADAASLSPNSFCRYFKTRTLKTYWQFLIELRIGYASKLLLEDNISVAQICYECGFNNLSNFNRHFKAILKMSPLQYMKTFKGSGKMIG